MKVGGADTGPSEPYSDDSKSDAKKKKLGLHDLLGKKMREQEEEAMQKTGVGEKLAETD